jgi:CTP synthase (UTP-ammonia lyase)
MRLVHHPFFLLTLFVPQTASRPERPHPLVTGYVAAARRRVQCDPSTICSSTPLRA